MVTSYYVMGGESATAGEPVSERTPAFRNIAIAHVTIDGATKQAIEIDGLPEMPITALRLSDVIASGQAGLTARYTDALELHNVQVNAARGPAFTIDAATGLELDNATSRKQAPGARVLELKRAPGAVIVP